MQFVANFKPQFTKTKKKHAIADRSPVDNTHDSVENYMSSELITFKPNQDIFEVIEKITVKRISGGPVLNDDGELVGLISEKDCLKVLVDMVYHNEPEKVGKVEDYMTKEVVTVSNHKDVVEVANLFLMTNFRRFPVVNDEGKLVGQVSRKDILKAVKKFKATAW
jgi:CBS domain-containing protein